MSSVVIAVALALLGWTAGCSELDPKPQGLQPASVIWQAVLPAFGPPTFDDNSVFFALRDHRLTAIDRTTGTVRWTSETDEAGQNFITQHTPVRAANVIVMGDEYLYAFDAATGKRPWTFTGETPGFAPRAGVYPFATDGTRIYAGSVMGSAFAIDAASGTQVWRADVMAGIDNQVRVMAVRGGRVYLNVRHSGPVYSGKVYALNAATGATEWSYELPLAPGMRNGTVDGIFVADSPMGALYVAAFDDGRIVALHPVTGAVVWTIPRIETLSSQNDIRRLTASSGVLVSTSTNGFGMVAGYNLADGAERWRAPSEEGSAIDVLSSDATFAYIPFSSGNLGAYELKTGTRRWLRSAPGGFFFSGPAVSGDTLFLGGWDRAYAIRK